MKMALRELWIHPLGTQTIIKTLMNSATKMVKQVNKNQVKANRVVNREKKRRRRKENGGQNSRPILTQAQKISVKLLMSLLMALLMPKMHLSMTHLQKRQNASILLITTQLVSKVENFLANCLTIKSSPCNELQSIKMFDESISIVMASTIF